MIPSPFLVAGIALGIAILGVLAVILIVGMTARIEEWLDEDRREREALKRAAIHEHNLEKLRACDGNPRTKDVDHEW